MPSSLSPVSGPSAVDPRRGFSLPGNEGLRGHPGTSSLARAGKKVGGRIPLSSNARRRMRGGAARGGRSQHAVELLPGARAALCIPVGAGQSRSEADRDRKRRIGERPSARCQRQRATATRRGSSVRRVVEPRPGRPSRIDHVSHLLAIRGPTLPRTIAMLCN